MQRSTSLPAIQRVIHSNPRTMMHNTTSHVTPGSQTAMVKDLLKRYRPVCARIGAFGISGITIRIRGNLSTHQSGLGVPNCPGPESRPDQNCTHPEAAGLRVSCSYVMTVPPLNSDCRSDFCCPMTRVTRQLRVLVSPSSTQYKHFCNQSFKWRLQQNPVSSSTRTISASRASRPTLPARHRSYATCCRRITRGGTCTSVMSPATTTFRVSCSP